MNNYIYSTNKTTLIEVRETKLDIELIASNPALPMINEKCSNITFKLDQIKEVDASGISWLLNLFKSYRKLGIKVYLTSKCKVYKALEFLGLAANITIQSEEHLSAI